MAGSAETTQRLTSGHRFLAVGGILIAATVIVATLVIIERRQETVESYQRELANLSVALSEQTARSVQAVDLVIKEAQEKVQVEGITTPAQFDRLARTEGIHHFLHERLAALPQAGGISLIGAGGTLVNGSREWPEPDVDFSDRDYYQHFLNKNDPDAFISTPVHGRLTGDWTFFLARRIDGPDGQFFGVALGVISVPYFEEFFKAITLYPGGSVSIFRRDGTMLARYPHVEGMIGQKLSPNSEWYSVVARGGGTYTSPGYIDGIARVVSVHPVSGYPLAVAVTVPSKAALAGWRQFAVIVSTLGGFVVVCFCVLFGALVRGARNTEQQTAALKKIAASLGESEARFRDIAEIGGDWVWETDTDHRFILFSGSEERLLPLGETPANIIGRTRWEVAGGDPDRDANWRDYKATIDAYREFRQFRYSVPTRSGRQLCISVNGRPIFDATGTFRGYRGTATEETETIEALYRAERAETLLRDAVDSISEAFVIYDADDHLVMCNQAYRELYWDSAEILEPGLLFEDLLRHGLTQQRYLDAIGREEEWLAARLERHRNPSGPIEAPLSGGRWALISEQRTRNGGYAGLRVDITQLKQTEAQLRQAMEHLDRVQRIAGIGSTTMDLTTGHFEWSAGARAIFGIDNHPIEPNVEFFRRFVHPDDRARVHEAAERARKDGILPPPLEYRIIRPDGAVRVVYRENDVQCDPGGRAVSRIATFRDITEQARIERSLRDAKDAAEAANLAKSQFLANVSHELRTPLNAIIGFSEMLERGLAGPIRPKQREYAGLVHQSGQHLLNVINDILDLAHVDSGKFELREDVGVDPRDIIDSCALLMRDRAKSGNLHLSTEIEDGLPLLTADPTRLKQILLNLLSNAIKFSEPGASIVAAARRSADEGVVLEVRDNGPGMTPDEIDIALTPFGQVDASHTRQHEGTGLGLPIARRLAELHGGQLHVSSKKGGGTAVTVTLPASRATIGGTVAIIGRVEDMAGTA